MAEHPTPSHPATTRAALDDRLRAAYRAAIYRFDTAAGELLLQVDRCSTDLQRLMRQARQPCAAVLTAFNPGSVLQDASSNLHAQSGLASELRALGLDCLPGRHEDPDCRWPAEAGLLALGLDRDAANTIAARYGQLAFLWSDASAIPRLVETTGAGLPPRP